MVPASHHPLDLRDPAMMSVLDAVPIASFLLGSTDACRISPQRGMD